MLNCSLSSSQRSSPRKPGACDTGLTSGTVVSGKGLRTGEATPSCRWDMPEGPGTSSCIEEASVAVPPKAQWAAGYRGSQVRVCGTEPLFPGVLSMHLQLLLCWYIVQARRVVSCIRSPWAIFCRWSRDSRRHGCRLLKPLYSESLRGPWWECLLILIWTDARAFCWRHPFNAGCFASDTVSGHK